MLSLPERCWMEVDLDQLHHNFQTIVKMLHPDCQCLAIVKGNGYGVGMIPIAKALQEDGCHCFGVAAMSEALALRENGIKGLILLLGPTYEQNIPFAAENEISMTVNSVDVAKRYAQALNGCSKPLKVHIKLDTGMSRIGFRVDDNVEEIVQDILSIHALPGIEVEGIYTHFSSAYNDWDDAFTRKQFSRFMQVVERSQDCGVRYRYRHCANSPAAKEYPAFQLDLARCGATVYGLFHGYHQNVDVSPIVSMRTRIVQINTLPAGTSIGYDRTCQLDRPRKIAVVSVGNGDGFLRFHSNVGHMICRGVRVPVCGIVCMDMTMLDVTDVPGVQVGDVVTVFGTDHGETLTAEEAVANVPYMIPNELYNGVTMRVPKYYLRGGKIVYALICHAELVPSDRMDPYENIE